MASIPSQRACAPRVGLEDRASMFAADIARSPLTAEEAERIARGIVQLDNFVRDADILCRLYEQVRATESRRLRGGSFLYRNIVDVERSNRIRLPSRDQNLEIARPAAQHGGRKFRCSSLKEEFR